MSGITESEFLEMKKAVDTIVASVGRLEAAVIGDKEFGHVGLVAQQQALKEECDRLKKELDDLRARIQTWAGIAIGASTALSLLINFIKL